MLRTLIALTTALLLTTGTAQAFYWAFPAERLRIVAEIDSSGIAAEHLREVLPVIRAELQDQKILISETDVRDDVLTLPLRDQADTGAALMLIREKAPGTVVTATGGKVRIELTADQKTALADLATAKTARVIESRFSKAGVRGRIRRGEENLQIAISMPVTADLARVRNLITRQAKLEFSLAAENPDFRDAGPGERRLSFRDEPDRQLIVRQEALITSADIAHAGAMTDYTGRPAISFRLTDDGTRKFGTATSENVGRQFAIILDDEIVSTPVIQSAIHGGRGIITGAFTPAETEQLAELLSGGALPAPLTIIEEAVYSVKRTD